MATRPLKFTAGFTTVELLIALAITAALLTAVAVAFNASVRNYTENEDIYKTVHTAQQALFRMTSQIRTGQSFDTAAPNNECSFFTTDGRDITYRFKSADNKLYLITNDDLLDDDYVLCTNVTSMNFIKTLTDEATDCKSVQISMTVESGNVQRKVSAAAVIRRNLK